MKGSELPREKKTDAPICSKKRDKSGPNPEVREPQKRRILTAKWKLGFIRKYDSASNEMEKGKLLRSEAVYRSQLSQWRRDIREGKLFLGCVRKRGPMSKKNPDMMALERENTRLKKELLQAKQIIELQKKVAALLGEVEDSEV
jgi:transposase-like protein